MLEGKPVIVHQYISGATKAAIFATCLFSMFLVGTVFGFAIGMQPVQVIIQPTTHGLDVPPYQDPYYFPDELIPLPEEPLAPIPEWQQADLKKETQCLADNIFFEAAFEGVDGWIAVANVTLNRVKSPEFLNTVCKVVWFQAVDVYTKKLTAHFSWTLDGKPDIVPEANRELYEEIYRMAEAMLAERTLDNFSDITDNALYYHANYVSPKWRKDYIHVHTIGAHLFYAVKGA